MSRRIEYGKRQINEKWWAVWITEQTHRGNDFCFAGQIFSSKAGINLISDRNPLFIDLEDGTPPQLFLRGLYEDCDNDPILIPVCWMICVEEAIAEYNEHYKERHIHVEGS